MNLIQLGWEEEHYWKRPWNPPKEQIEQRPTHTKTSSPMPVATVAKPRDTARQTATGKIKMRFHMNICTKE